MKERGNKSKCRISKVEVTMDTWGHIDGQNISNKERMGFRNGRRRQEEDWV